MNEDDHELATWSHRLGATIVDFLVFLAVNVVLQATLSRAVAGGVFAGLEALYTVGLIAALGQTIGNRAVGTKVIATTGAPAGLPRSVVRWLTALALEGTVGLSLAFSDPALSILGALFLLDILWPIWDARNQTLHDKAARTLVIRV